MTTGMKQYSKSAIYPHSPEAIESIAANMRENGFDRNFPILIKGNEIVDGYHRYKAAQLAGVEPVFEEFDGDEKDALRLVLRANGDRRHLNEGQKASAAIVINRALGKDAATIKSLAKNYGVSEATVNRMVSYSNEELEGIVSGKKTQAQVKANKQQGSGVQALTYTLTKAQAARVAALAVTLDERGKKLLSRIFTEGITVIEVSAAA